MNNNTEKKGNKIERMLATMEVIDSMMFNAQFPKPAVAVVDTALSVDVVNWVTPDAVPPAMIARDHFRRGLKSVTDAAIIITPATVATGIAMVSRRLSTYGKK